ncbi:MAG: thioesterase family protein [Anaerolineae bacterium]
MTLEIPLGITATEQHIVGGDHLATHWHSGPVQVLATPQMIAWMEMAATKAAEPYLPEGYCTVGTLVEVRHLAATAPGALVTVKAELIESEGRSLTFTVEAVDEAGLIGQGRHARYVVNLERFESQARSRTAGKS